MDENNYEINENTDTTNSSEQTTTINASQNPENGEYEYNSVTSSNSTQDPSKADSLNITCFVCGLLSIFNNLIPYLNILPGYLYGTIAIIFYILGKGRNGRGFATAGLVLGIIGLIVSLTIRLIILAFFKSVFSAFFTYFA